MLLQESLIFNKTDLEFNVDRFESGESNVLLITGFSGSGKSTLAGELATKYGCEHFQLDWMTDYVFGSCTKEDLVEEGEYGLLDFIDQENLPTNLSFEDFTEQEIIDLIRKYIKFLIEWCKQQSGQKFIIDGLQIYNEYKEGDSHITSCPMIIKGTSGLISTLRAAKRNNGSAISNFGPLIRFIFRDNKKLNKLEKDYNKLNSFADEFKLYENLWEQQEVKDQYTYKHDRGFYKVYKNGKYILTCDHEWEIDKEIAEYEKEQAEKKETKYKYMVSWSIINKDDSRQDFTKNNIYASNEAEARHLANIPNNPYVRNVSVIKL